MKKKIPQNKETTQKGKEKQERVGRKRLKTEEGKHENDIQKREKPVNNEAGER